MAGSRQRYGILLLALFATFFFYGVAQPGDLQRTIGTVLVGTTLLLALYAAKVRPSAMRAAVVVVTAIVVAVIIASLADSESTAAAITAIASAVMLIVAPTAVAVGVNRQLQATGVTAVLVAGVLCLYMLFGLFFAFVYVAVENLGGAPFFANGASAVPARAVYFSFVSLATVGYGDYTARTNFGHTLSVTEALLGQIYLVTIVAAIVSRFVALGKWKST